MALVNGPRKPPSAITELAELLEKTKTARTFSGATSDLAQEQINLKILEALKELKKSLPLGPI